MADLKMIEAIVISIVLSALVFRTNYFSNVKVSRTRYTEKGVYNYGMLILDIITALAYSLIGCYLAWDSIVHIPIFAEYRTYITPASILSGLIFQQALPIAIELAMNKLNTFKQKSKE